LRETTLKDALANVATTMYDSASNVTGTIDARG